MPSAFGPERDRRLAQQPRYRYRAAQPLSDEIDALMDSEVIRRLRRFRKANDVLRTVLGEATMRRLKPVRLQTGELTIEVLDGPLLAELRQHRERTVLAALIQGGTGITKVTWRLARSRSA